MGYTPTGLRAILAPSGERAGAGGADTPFHIDSTLQYATMNTRDVQIIGVPVDLGAGRRGVDMGPSALRVAEIDRHVAELGFNVDDAGDLHVTVPESVGCGDTALRFVDGIQAISRNLAQTVKAALDGGTLPLVLGGDHSIAIGSLAGSSAHLADQNQKLGVIWFDAHADINTSETSPSGNIHGMGLAVNLGFGDERLTAIGNPGPKIDGRNVALVGIRDLDAGERELLRNTGVHVFTIRNIDERGMRHVMDDAIRVASAGTAGLHIQLDVDVMDPEEAPGTGTPVHGGLTYREAHLAMEMVADAGNVIAMDVVEINPILGERNETAELAVELVLSVLGKRIF